MAGGIDNPNNSQQKLSQSISMVKDYLEKTDNKNLLITFFNPDLKIYPYVPDQVSSQNKSGGTIEAARQKDSIFFDNKFVQESDPVQIGGRLIHELNHLMKNSPVNSRQEERECFKLQEDFLDSKGQGQYDENKEDLIIQKGVDATYPELVEKPQQ